MELRDAESGDFLALAPTRYEFPDLVGVEYDSDWLIVSGEARFGDEAWRWAEPVLLVIEAHELADWLDGVERTSTGVRLDFLEPNLAFEVLDSDEDTIRLQVFLTHESAPPSRLDDERFVSNPCSLRLARGSLARAARDLRASLQRFPSRE